MLCKGKGPTYSAFQREGPAGCKDKDQPFGPMPGWAAPVPWIPGEAEAASHCCLCRVAAPGNKVPLLSIVQAHA